MHENKCGFLLRQLRFQPLQLFFSQTSTVGIEARGLVVLGRANKVVQVNEFATLLVQGPVRIDVELGLE